MKKNISGRFIIVLVIAGIIGIISAISSNNGNVSFITNIVGSIISPVQKGITNIANVFVDGYNYFFEFDTLKEENLELKRELRATQAKLRENSLSEKENKELRKLLSIKQKNKNMDFEISEVIARNNGNWSSTINIDKGSNSGLEVGNLVMTEDGMVGFISNVGYNYSEVTTVIDSDMSAGCILSRTREVTVAQGDIELMKSGYLKLSYIPTDSEIVIGDTVETSGTGGIFPKGIMIGTVEKILPEPHGISNYAIIKPSSDILSAKTVYIIKKYEITE